MSFQIVNPKEGWLVKRGMASLQDVPGLSHGAPKLLPMPLGYNVGCRAGHQFPFK